MTPPGPGFLTATFLCITVGKDEMLVLNRWLLGQDWCPLEPFAAAGPIAVDRRWARAGAVLPLRYVPLHHGREPPWEDFPPKGLRLLGVDDDAVVVGDGLDGVPDEPCLSPRVKRSTNSNELLRKLT